MDREGEREAERDRERLAGWYRALLVSGIFQALFLKNVLSWGFPGRLLGGPQMFDGGEEEREAQR